MSFFDLPVLLLLSVPILLRSLLLLPPLLLGLAELLHDELPAGLEQLSPLFAGSLEEGGGRALLPLLLGAGEGGGRGRPLAARKLLQKKNRKINAN